jgi:hypothetical protein
VRTEAKADVYVGLLAVSVAALLFGIVFLILELGKYGWQSAAGV